MTKEELIKLGLTEEQAAAVAQRFAEAAEEAASAKKQIAELAKKSETISAELESIKAASGKAETDYAELKKKYEDDTAALRAEKDNAEKGYLIDAALTARHAKNIKAYMDVIGAQVSDYWEDVDQQLILSTLKGVFSMSTGDANKKFVAKHTYDISETASPMFALTTLNTALQRALGDKVNPPLKRCSYSILRTGFVLNELRLI